MPMGNLKEVSLEQAWNSEQQKKLRKDLLAGKTNKICTRCMEMERNNISTTRQWSNKHLNNHWDVVEATKEDGSVDKVNLPYIDFRFSNICNFKCRTCGPELSSSWYEDHSKIWGKPDHKKIIRPYKDEKTFWEKVEPYMDGLELWNQFECVSVGASLDASHKRGEFLRKGQSWEQVEANRKRMFDACPRAYFFLATCLDVFNSFHVPDFHIDWYKRGWIQDEGSLINPLLTPNYLRIQILPEMFKDQLREKYRKAQEWMDTNTKNKSKRYDALIQFLDEADYSHKIKEWIRSTNQLDSLRSENWRDIFPELTDLEKYK